MYPYIHILGRAIPSYALCILAAIATVFLLASRDCKKCGLSVYDLILAGTVSVFIGLFGAAVLYALVTYTPRELLSMMKAGNFSFLEKGLVFYGGLLSGIAGLFLGLKIAKCSFGDIEFCVTPYLPLAHTIGRIGCLLGGCCYGFAYSGPFAIYYPHALSGLSPQQGYFPTPILEAVLNLGVCVLLLQIRKRKFSTGGLLASYLCTYGVVRIITELFRGDAVRGIFMGISTSQWISIILIVFSLGFLIFKRCKQE